jgi:hypothetical protein
MLDPEGLPQLREAVQRQTSEDAGLLKILRGEVRPLRASIRRVSPRTTTAMSLVASDGGNNKIQFDPFLMQLVRVVDSYGQVLCLDVVSPTTDTDQLSDRQFEENGAPKTALGYMMKDLGVRKLYDLSPMIPRPGKKEEGAAKPSWVLVYRDLCEWAVLYERICRYDFPTDTLIVRDGLLRSKVFATRHGSEGLFIVMRNRIKQAIERAREKQRRRIYLVGLAKHSKVLARYQLAMTIENIMDDPYPCYLEIPRALEQKAYVWPEYARGEEEGGGGEAPKYVAGKMFFGKFGGRSRDPIWPVDLLDFQADEAPVVFGYLLADCSDGFPVPCYPRCLQKAHENAALVGFDMDILQEEIFKAIRQSLPAENVDALDTYRLGGDPSNLRYE